MAKETPIVGLDVILQQLGAFGKYNIVNYALLLFPVFLAGMYGQVFVFEAPDVDYRLVFCIFIIKITLYGPYSDLCPSGRVRR